MRVRNKPLRRQPATPQIATRQSRPRNVKLARYPNRHRQQTVVENVDAQIQQQIGKTQETGLKQTLEGVPRMRYPPPIIVPTPGQPSPEIRATPERMPDEVVRSTALQLRVFKDRVATSQDILNSYLVEFYKKFAIPFASIVFVLIGAPLALRFPRGGTGTVIAISLAIFGIYYVGLIGGETLSDRGDLSPFVAMWGTNIIFLLLSVYGVATIGHERSNARAGTWSDLYQTAREGLTGLIRGRRRLVRAEGR